MSLGSETYGESKFCHRCIAVSAGDGVGGKLSQEGNVNDPPASSKESTDMTTEQPVSHEEQNNEVST